MDHSKLQSLIRKLTGTPFLPVLFISKSIEEAAYLHVQPAARMSVLSIAATVLWLYTSEDVAWGLKKAAEKVEEATEDDDNT